VYEIGPRESAIRFAAGEFSSGIWAFFIPAQDWRYRVTEVVPGQGPGKVILVAGATDLPAGVQVEITLKAPDGSVIEVSGLKEWELPIDGPPFQHDAFLLPSVEQDIAIGTLAEVGPLQPAIRTDGPAPAELPMSLSFPQPALVQGAGNVGPSPDAPVNSSEVNRGADVLFLSKAKTLSALWTLYVICAACILYRLPYVVLETAQSIHLPNFLGDMPRIYFYRPLVWLILLLLYLIVAPVTLMKFHLVRATRK
jgi:hypothetical protein